MDVIKCKEVSRIRPIYSNNSDHAMLRDQEWRQLHKKQRKTEKMRYSIL